jgi:cytochrome c oxidase assembly protein subunit 16
MVFQSRTFRPASYSNTLPAKYRAQLKKHPFLLFGLPFVFTILAGSFFLTPAAAIRYERYDRQVQRVSTEDQLGLEKKEKRVRGTMKEEYYRLSMKDVDNWEQKRVERRKGEGDGILR